MKGKIKPRRLRIIFYWGHQTVRWNIVFEKYFFIVDLLSCLSDKQGLIEESKLSLLISNCVQIPRQLGELGSFGGANIEPSVQSCLEQVQYKLIFSRKGAKKWIQTGCKALVIKYAYNIKLAFWEDSKTNNSTAVYRLCKSSIDDLFVNRIPIINIRWPGSSLLLFIIMISQSFDVHAFKSFHLRF